MSYYSIIFVIIGIILSIITISCKKKCKFTREDFILFESNFEIKESNIQGVGIISKIKIQKNTVLFKCVENKVILPIGTKVNHCQFEKSNTILVEYNNDWYLKSIKDIEIGEEITCDYNTTPRNIIARANPNWKC